MARPMVAVPALLLLGVLALQVRWLARRQGHRRRGPTPVAAPPAAPAPRPYERPPPVRAVDEPPPPPPATPPEPPPRSLRVRPVPPLGLAVRAVEVTLLRRGDDEPEIFQLDGALEGLFAIHWLPAGSYDVTVAVPELPAAHAEWPASTDGQIEIPLRRRALLQGVLGAGGRYQRRFYVRIDDAAGGVRVIEVRSPSFSAEIEASGPATVVARLPADELRATVDVPERGDPSPLCLGPPCAELPAALAVWIADARGTLVAEARLEWTASQISSDEERGGVKSVAGVGYVEDLRPGDRVHLRATVVDQEAPDAPERPGEADVVAGYGVTDVVVRIQDQQAVR